MTLLASSAALEALTARSTFGTGVVTCVAVGSALIFGSEQIREARAARDLTKRLDIERSQPYVVAYIETSEASEQIVQLVIKNFGQTAAHNVRVQIDPWPERANMDGEHREVGIPTTMPILAPGQEWKTIWDVARERMHSDLPDRHEGMLIYDGIDGKQIETPVVLDWSVFKPRMYTDIKTMHHAAKSLSEIEKSLKSFRSGLHGRIDVTLQADDADDTQLRTGFADPAFFTGRPTINDPIEQTEDEQPK